MSTTSRQRGVGVYVAGEAHNFCWGRLAKPGARLVVCAQGSHSLADSIVDDTSGSGDPWDRAQALMDAGFVLAQGDMSQTTTQGTFGNSTAETRLGQLRTLAVGTGVPCSANGAKHYLIAGSGGCTAALNYAKSNPTLVASLYLQVPAVDIENIHDLHTDASITSAEIETAFGGAAGYAAAMPTRNPMRNPSLYAVAPMRLLYSTNDPYIEVQKVLDFATAINAAGGHAETMSMGAVGHATTGLDPADCVRFFQAHP